MSESSSALSILYEVVESDYLLSLKAEVTDLLHKGYELAGGVTAYAYRDSNGDMRIYYLQALIKMESQTE